MNGGCRCLLFGVFSVLAVFVAQSSAHTDNLDGNFVSILGDFLFIFMYW